jgi:tetratricopeptide (TPR) repeat protein
VSDTPQVQAAVRTVTLHRRKGDALARAGRDQDAKEAYNTALSLLNEALGGLGISFAEPAASHAFSDVNVAADVADLLAMRGGILRRLGRVEEALESYRRGADWEASQDLPATYSRTNAVKLALIAGDRTVAQVHDELVALRTALERRLSTDERAADDAWLWADLGDVRLLLGDDNGAESAYRAFLRKARTDSVATTLSVLRQIVDALDAYGDADAERVAASLGNIEGTLSVY